jgi:glycosyltransferase involved in cell wall biosynthesis
MTERRILLPITVIIPVKNEEKNIVKCLNCLKPFDEIIVVDSDSEDRTIELANSFNVRIVNFNWNGHFPKKRNWVLRNVEIKHEWVLFLDSDELVTDALVNELSRIMPKTEHSGFWITYDDIFFGRKLIHGDKLRKLSLFRKSCGEYEKVEENCWSNLDMEVHEHPLIEGTVGKIKATINHTHFRGIKAYLDKHNNYSTWESKRFIEIKKSWKNLNKRQKLKYRLLNTWFLGFAYFFYTYIVKRGFLDGKAGFVFAILKLMYFWTIKIKILEHRCGRK